MPGLLSTSSGTASAAHSRSSGRLVCAAPPPLPGRRIATPQITDVWRRVILGLLPYRPALPAEVASPRAAKTSNFSRQLARALRECPAVAGLHVAVRNASVVNELLAGNTGRAGAAACGCKRPSGHVRNGSQMVTKVRALSWDIPRFEPLQTVNVDTSRQETEGKPASHGGNVAT